MMDVSTLSVSSIEMARTNNGDAIRKDRVALQRYHNADVLQEKPLFWIKE